MGIIIVAAILGVALGATGLYYGFLGPIASSPGVWSRSRSGSGAASDSRYTPALSKGFAWAFSS
jgi:hypothetical protein